MGISSCPSTICWKDCLFPHWMSPGTLVENHLTIYARVCFWALYSISLVYIFVFMPVSYCFDYCSFLISFEIRKSDFSNFVLFSRLFCLCTILSINFTICKMRMIVASTLLDCVLDEARCIKHFSGISINIKQCKNSLMSYYHF